MRLLMYRREGQSRLGVLEGRDVLDVGELARASGSTMPSSLLTLIEGGEE